MTAASAKLAPTPAPVQPAPRVAEATRPAPPPAVPAASPRATRGHGATTYRERTSSHAGCPCQARAERHAAGAHGGSCAGPGPAAASATGQRAAGAPTEERLKRLYDEYTSARKRNNEGEVRYDHLVSSIQKMLPELQKKHHGKSIDFEVVVKDGRVGLKPKAL